MYSKFFHSEEWIIKVADSYAGFTGYVWTGPNKKEAYQTTKMADTSLVSRVRTTAGTRGNNG